VLPRITGVSSPIVKWVRHYVAAPRHRQATHHHLHAADGTRVHALTVPGPPDCGVTVVISPGFGHWHRHPKIVELVNAMARHANVVLVELRGHGSSQGECSLGTHEHQDVAAAVQLVAPGDRMVLIGISMGAAAAVVYAGTAQRKPDAIVSISGPGWWDRGNPARGVASVLERAESRIMRAGMHAFMRVRVAAPNSEGWIDPVDVAADLGAPLTIVHDRADKYFRPEQAEGLAAAAGPTTQIWWRTGGHATDLFNDALYDDLASLVIDPLRAAR
jgi:pimeloyl-ACP methyl ester carboxylesterase